MTSATGADGARTTSSARLNLIDDAARQRAAASVRQGRAFTLGLPLSEADGVQMGFIEGRENPKRSMIQINKPLSEDPAWICSSEDVATLALQSATHWDALAHCSYQGHLYNGYPSTDVTELGAARCAIDQVGPLISRGLLLDVARSQGRQVLAPGYAITPDDLDAALALTGLSVEPGDIVLVHTGQTVHLALDGRLGLGGAAPKRDLIAYTYPSPGLTMETARWFHAHDVAAVAIDTLVFEVYPSQYEEIYLPVHLLHLVEMGLTQGQNWVLDLLAADCAADGQYDFLLDATPLPFRGGLGTPLNPVALK